jgi:hypothetical protein
MWPVSPQLRTFGQHSRKSALFWHTSSRNDDMHMIKYDLTTRSTDFATHIPHRAFIPSRSDHLIRPNSCPQPGQEHRPCQHLSHFRKDRSAQRVTLFAYRSNLQHSHYHHRSMASVYHQTLAPPFFPIPDSTFHGFLSGVLLPRLRISNLAGSTRVPSIAIWSAHACGTRNLSRWKQSLTTLLTTAALIAQSHQLL